MTTEEILSLSNQHPVILFDGVCNMCDGFVQFVMKRDGKGIFRFAPLQSETGRALLRHFDLDETSLKTVVLIENEQFYTKSTVPLKVAKRIGGAWALGYIFIVLPKSIRDWGYDFIAKNRYRLFGEKDSCMMPTPEVRSRFLS